MNSVGFVNNCTVVMDKIRQTVGDKFDLVLQPTVTFDKDTWDRIPMSSKELGCNPDFNAWTGDRNPSPAAVGMMRAAGGHLHFGWTKDRDPNDPDHFADCRLLVKQLDYYLGTASIMWDGNQDRRKMYGMAGAFRPKSYGVEYRSLSNRWLSSPMLMKWVYNAAYTCVNNLLNGGDPLEDVHGDLARRVIDGSEKWWDGGEMREVYYNKIGIELPLAHLDKVYSEKKEEKPSKTKADPKHKYGKKSSYEMMEEIISGMTSTSMTGTSTTSF